jgi:hypothetical protein
MTWMLSGRALVALLSILTALLLGACDPEPPPEGRDAGHGRDAGGELDAGEGVDAGVVPPGPERSTPSAYIRGELPRLIIELDATEGYAPRPGVRDLLVEVYAPLLDKPAGIHIVDDETLPSRGPETLWTFAELEALVAERFNRSVPADAAVFHTIWLEGGYDTGGAGTVLGVAWSNRYLVIFPDAIAEACEGNPLTEERLCREAESAVWVHEVGHVIGLVNNGIPMVTDHEDPDHPGHTGDPDGVMYWAYETPSGLDLLLPGLGGSERTFQFSAPSLADIAAIRDAP